MSASRSRGEPPPAQVLPATPSARLRDLLAGPDLVRVAGAHNALGARLAERAGFDAVWSSGLEVSASQGLPDADILTMPELLAAAQSMAAAVHLPVVADCDAGYGNSNNVMHMVRRYEAAGIAAVCIEDKRFPKLNSFASGRQDLASVAEFAGKVMAAKAAQCSSQFMVIARVEALIAGYSLDEALGRAHAYADAGADAVLIHDNAPSPDAVLEFVGRWGGRLPVVVVPTTYFAVTVDELRSAGVSMVIYANHGLRASIAAISSTFAEILDQGTTAGVEPRIAPLELVFELQGLPQLQRDEHAFLQSGGPALRAVMLPARDPLDGPAPGGAGAVPAAMLDISGRSLVQRQVDAVVGGGAATVHVASEAGEVAAAGATVLVDEQRPAAGEVSALLRAGDSDAHTLAVSGDVLCDDHLIRLLVEADGDITVVVDTTFGGGAAGRGGLDLVELAAPATTGRRLYTNRGADVARIGGAVDAAAAGAEFAGITMLSPKGLTLIREGWERLRAAGAAAPTASLSDLLQLLVDEGHAVKALDMPSGWMEIRSVEDYRLACELTSP